MIRSRTGRLGRPSLSGSLPLELALAFVAVAAGYQFSLRPRHLRWGATTEEASRPLPGDDPVPDLVSQSTHAVSIDAPPEEVWPWIVQLGQGRGGFDSYDWLENAVGADIHNADRILPEHQRLAEGELVRMAPRDYWLRSPVTAMVVDRIDEGRTVVLRGDDGGTWAFHLDPAADGSTRFLVRSRSPNPRTLVGRAFHYLAFEPAHFVMERRMMLGIKRRAERARRTRVENET